MPSPAQPLLRSTVVPRRPAVLATTLLSLGIILDSQLDISVHLWLAFLGLTSFTLCICIILSLNYQCRSICLFGVLLSLGGIRHHNFYSIRSSENIQYFATYEANPVRLIGTISSEIEIIESEHGPRIPAWMEIDKSRFHMQVEQIAHGRTWESVDGIIRVDLDGHLIHARIGERIELFGAIYLPAPIKNPGGFDYQKYLSRQGIDALCRVKHPLAVNVLEDPHPWYWKISRLRESVRDEARTLFTIHLSKPAKIIALSLLLGDRSQLNQDLRERFAESGAMHLLAISGLHIGILAGLIVIICRVLNFSLTQTRLIVVIGVLLFATLTNHRPPVLRATMLISILALGTTIMKRVDAFNVLAFCAAVLILWKPTDLFDIGAQLSFLAVGAIIWSSEIFLRSQRYEEERLPTPEGRRWILKVRPLFNYFAHGYFITAAIWLVTLPLTMSVFNLVSLIGYLLNVFLIPYAAITLSFGYLFLILGLYFPSIAHLLAIPVDVLLRGLLQIIEWAQALTFGHFHCNGFPMWWLIGFYVLVACIWKLYPVAWLQRKQWKFLAIWIMVGLLTGWSHSEKSILRFTVLSVGHGLASVIELPTGETILYDAGTFGDGRRADRTIEDYLRQRKIKQIDALIVSHADHDHFSGAFGLMKKFPIRTIFVSQQFLDFEQHSVKDFCAAAAEHNISIRILQAGDSLSSASGSKSDFPQLQVLHPSAEFRSKYDNANSIVLSIQYLNCRLLLTGDIEKDGVSHLIDQSPRPFHVIMAPHHGSKNSSPQEFFDWISPQYILISSGNANATQRLQDQVGSAIKVLGTQSSGAITVEVNEKGILKISSFIKDQ